MKKNEKKKILLKERHCVRGENDYTHKQNTAEKSIRIRLDDRLDKDVRHCLPHGKIGGETNFR